MPGVRRILLAAALALTLPTGAAAQTAPKPKKPEKPVRPFVFQAKAFPGGALPDKEPQNVPLAGAAPTLALSTSYIGHDAAEPTIAPLKDGRVVYVAAGFNPAGLAVTSLFRTADNGRSWQDITPVTNAPTTLDPYVYADPVSNRLFSIDLEALAGSYIMYSDDAGDTFNSTAITAPAVNDHQAFFSGPVPADDPLALQGDRRYWYCVNGVSHVACSYSDDGGQTFVPVANPPYAGCAGCQTGHGAVDSQGRMFLPRGGLPGGADAGPPQVAITPDGGQTWKTVTVAPRELESAIRHTGIEVDRDDNLYYVWHDAKHLLPYMAVSRNHGETWGKPVMIAPPGVHDANFPEIAAGEKGRVAIIFPGSSVDDQTDTTRPWHGWVLTSTNALDPEPTFQATPIDRGDDPLHRGACNGRCSGMFDFLDVQVSPADGTVWASFVDTCVAVNKCTTTRQAGLAQAAEAVAVHQIGGERLVGPPLPGTPSAVAPAPPSRLPRPDRTKPRITRLSVGTSKGRRVVRYRLSEAASVTLTVRKGRKVVGRLTTGRPTRSGSLPLRGLPRGRLVLTLVARDAAGNRGRAVRRSFRVR